MNDPNEKTDATTEKKDERAPRTVEGELSDKELEGVAGGISGGTAGSVRNPLGGPIGSGS